MSRPQKWGRDTNFNNPGRDLRLMSRPASSPPTETPLSRPKTLVATPNHQRQPEPCRDIKSVSRHHSGHSRSRPQNGVATPFLLPSPKPGRDTETRSQPSWRLTYVATSTSCRDFVPVHSVIPRSRRQNPSRDLPHCHPCRDLKNDVATSNPTGQITTSNFQVATPKGHLTLRPQFHVATPFSPKSEQTMSQPQNDVATPIHNVLLRRQNPWSPSLRPTTTQPGRDATSWSRPHAQPNQVATS